MLATDCTRWTGNPRRHQHEAGVALTVEGREPSPYAWITATCGEPMCLNADHLRVHAPVHLDYPRHVCVYCGRHAWTKDHLLPRNWTGDAKRTFVVTVPACGGCNSTLGDTLTWSITERRAICHTRLRRKYAKVLRTRDHSESELEELGDGLRDYILDEMDKRREVERMLSWPEDPAYDERAFAASGIEDPWAIGLILPDDADLAAVVAAVA